MPVCVLLQHFAVADLGQETVFETIDTGRPEIKNDAKHGSEEGKI